MVWVQIPPKPEKKKGGKAVQKSVTGDVSIGALNQARLRPLYGWATYSSLSSLKKRYVYAYNPRIDSCKNQ